MAAQQSTSRPFIAQESCTATIPRGTPAKLESLFSIRFCSDGQTFDLQRIFLGGALSVSEKQQAGKRVEFMKGQQFYLALRAASAANKVPDFARRIGANEPILKMDEEMLSWDLATRNAPNTATRICRLKLCTEPPTMEILDAYLRRAQHRLATPLIKAAVSYLQMRLPHSQILQHALESNGVVANAMSAYHAIRRSQMLSGHDPPHVYLSPQGNALSLLSNEWSLLCSLHKLMDEAGHVSSEAAFPVFAALAIRQSQLLDHACYRALDGQYSAANFFVHQARAADELRSSVFGTTWPSCVEIVSKATSVQPELGLNQILEAARRSLEGLTFNDWLKDSLSCWPSQARDAVSQIAQI
ncbi:uncharacterized protein AB675_7693 [Cyphellophora attinorum]|uniref:Uncharacterized protein n=1 Tax=Cyphellophora attinorum TaxID=1664694 RepID=A0A0N0NMC7_9EURO|nr:uncharacterized protein AB675_7693 [Phialophora attinorum]KPI40301.1 hypothetical protein AB675_7693 [Phialophora attinorum]